MPEDRLETSEVYIPHPIFFSVLYITNNHSQAYRHLDQGQSRRHNLRDHLIACIPIFPDTGVNYQINMRAAIDRAYTID